MSTALSPMESTVERWSEHPRVKKILCSSLGRIINRHTKKEYKGSLTEDDYLRTTINEDGVAFLVVFHRFIAESFIGISTLTVNHINGVKTDNRAENLEYLSRADNVRHACKTGLRKNRSTNTHNASLDEFSALTLATLHNAGLGQTIIAEKMNLHRATVSRTVKGRTYKDLSFLFNILPRDQHNKYTLRAIKEGKWVINNDQSEAV
jgi:predicted DNA-binding protein (UPF0251 family)